MVVGNLSMKSKLLGRGISPSDNTDHLQAMTFLLRKPLATYKGFVLPYTTNIKGRDNFVSLSFFIMQFFLASERFLLQQNKMLPRTA